MEKNRYYHLLGRHLNTEILDSEKEELQAFKRSQRIDPELENIISEYWQQQPNFDQDFLNATYHIHLAKRSQNKPQQKIFDLKLIKTFFKKSIKWTSFAAVAILLFFLGRSWFSKTSYLNSKPNSSQIKKTNLGTKSHFFLNDGTEVWLNSGSTLNYPRQFNKNKREVQLVGEAYFKVSHKNNQPFYINTPNFKIKVLGTEFNVKNYEKDAWAETTLISGKIELNIIDKKDIERQFILKPKEKCILNTQSHAIMVNKIEKKVLQDKTETILENMNPIESILNDTTFVETAWLNNILSFDNQSFFDVSEHLKRWYNYDFIFENSKAKDVMMSGTFKNQSIDQVLKILEYSFGIKFEVKDKIIIVK
ncbi:MAG: FecR family protein [Alphaproteobacteria bacterium]|nr:FecR family protein [Alphaproteobacteria bacterium]